MAQPEQHRERARVTVLVVLGLFAEDDHRVRATDGRMARVGQERAVRLLELDLDPWEQRPETLYQRGTGCLCVARDDAHDRVLREPGGELTNEMRHERPEPDHRDVRGPLRGERLEIGGLGRGETGPEATLPEPARENDQTIVRADGELSGGRRERGRTVRFEHAEGHPALERRVREVEALAVRHSAR